MVLGQLFDLLVPKQVNTAVTDVADIGGVLVYQYGYYGGPHSNQPRIIFAGLNDMLIGLLNCLYEALTWGERTSILQRGGKEGSNRFNRQLAGDLSSNM